MEFHTFIITSIIVPFVAIAVIAPAIRKKRYKLVALVLAAIVLTMFISISGRDEILSDGLRSFSVGLVGFLCGFLYEKFFMDRDIKGS